MLTIWPNRMNAMHNASCAHVANPRTAARLAHHLLRPSRPSDPAASARSRSHARSRIHTASGPRRRRTAHRRHGIARCACALGSMGRRIGAACAGTCGARSAAPPPIQSKPARAGQASPGCECCARQAPSFERRLHVPARHQPVRWPRNQPLEVALQKAGGHASGMASVRRRRRVVAHRRGDLKMRDVLLVSIVVCVLT